MRRWYIERHVGLNPLPVAAEGEVMRSLMRIGVGVLASFLAIAGLTLAAIMLTVHDSGPRGTGATSGEGDVPSTLEYGTVTDGYTIGFVNRQGVVSAFTPQGDLPTSCTVQAVAVADYDGSAWVTTSVQPTAFGGSGTPESLMATFYGPTNGAYVFHADMHLDPQFRTPDYYAGLNFSKALVLHEDC
jgi:hypothetical protein